ncbi:hypothetical protein E8E14_010221 [Neopestalotiopsis sp. 37M]|nr:hypothetical protein E8E14_010221 [Neopestalotiopsis sp. 37M]
MGNILLRLPSSLDHLSDEQLCDEFHAPEPLPVSRVDKKPLSLGVPRHVFSPMWLGEAGAKLSPAEARILLADFGTAFDPAKEQRFESYTPLIIQPPESIFDPKTPLSFKSDIWSLACTMLAILGRRTLVNFWSITEDAVTADLIDALGPLPEEWWDRWGEEKRSEYFINNGQRPEGRPPYTWDEYFEENVQEDRRARGMETFGDEERKDLFEMLKWMLSFRPEERPAAKQVLETAWMRKWAIPEFQRTRTLSTFQSPPLQITAHNYKLETTKTLVATFADINEQGGSSG